MSQLRVRNLKSKKGIKTVSALIMVVFFIFLASGCGGGGSDSASSRSGVSANSASSSNSLQGTFLDSPVAGITYNTETHSGTTDKNGTFFYMAGERIRFKLGDVYMGQATAAPKMTPIDIVPGATDTTHPTVTNMIRFMQTLDIDGNPNNGIIITEQVRGEVRGRGISFHMGIREFEHDPNVVMCLDALNAMNRFGGHRRMVPVDRARDHMDETLWEHWERGGGNNNQASNNNQVNNDMNMGNDYHMNNDNHMNNDSEWY